MLGASIFFMFVKIYFRVGGHHSPRASAVRNTCEFEVYFLKHRKREVASRIHFLLYAPPPPCADLEHGGIEYTGVTSSDTRTECYRQHIQ